MAKIIGRVTLEEKTEIMDLYKKKIALESLVKIIDNNEELLQRLIIDYGNIILSYNDWWGDKAKKYKWEGSNWLIDFATNEISTSN